MGKRLFVGNLSFGTTAEALNTTFAADGRQVESVDLMTDRDTGRSRGFAFIEMKSDEDANQAIEALNGTDLDGRSLRVDHAEERRPRGGGGGGGGRRERW